MSRLILTAAVTVLATLAAPTAARADFVDTFANPSPGDIYQIALLNTNPYTSPTTVVSAGVSRSIQVTVASPNPPNFNSVSGTIGGGTFTMDSDNNSAATSVITYSLSGAAGNLSGAGSLELGFLNFDAGTAASSTPVRVEIVTSSGTLTGSATIAESATPFTQSFAFGSLTGSGNLSQVNTIRITINNGSSPQTAVDFALDGVKATAAPAPLVLLLAAIGLLGLVGRARLRRTPA